MSEEQSRSIEEEIQVKKRSKKMLVYLIIFSSVMLFAGFTSAYLVISSDNFWVITNTPTEFWISAIIAIISSITVYAALVTVKKGNNKLTTRLLSLTFVLGIVFTVFQFKGWEALTKKGMFLVGGIMDIEGEYGKDYLIRFPNKLDGDGNKVKGPILEYENGQYYHPEDVQRREPLNAQLEEQANTASAFVYVFVGMHLLHVFLAMIYLLINMVRSTRGVFSPQNHLSIQLCGILWHFLGGLWIYLLAFMNFVY